MSIIKSCSMVFSKGRILFSFLVVVFLFVFSNAYGADALDDNTASLTDSSGKEVTINFQDLSIKKFMELIAKVMNKNILFESDVKGNIDFVSTTPLKKDELIPLAIAILGTKSYTIIDSNDGFLRVVKTADASGEGLSLADSSAKNSNQTMNVYIFRPKVIGSDVLVSRLKPLLPKNSAIVSLREFNALIIATYPWSIEPIRDILEQLENNTDISIEIFQFKKAKVKNVYNDVLNMTRNLFPRNIATEAVSVVQNQSSNTMAIIGNRANINRVKNILEKLDVEDEIVNQKLFVIKIINSDAETLSKTLNDVVSKKVYKDGEPKTVITFDSEQNSLIVLDTVENFLDLNRTINLLDVEKPQIYVKTRIVEVSTDKLKDLGVQYGVSGFSLDTSGLYSFAFNPASSIVIPSEILSNLDLDILQQGLALGASIGFYENEGAATTLSEPSLIATNNAESEIYVGETRSVLEGSTVGSSDTDLTRNTYTREDIGITLKVKPRISSENQVVLEVEVTVEDIAAGEAASTSISALLPTTTKRSVTTTSVAKNGSTVILGGLLKSVEGKSVGKIPLLGDIPILGGLFRYETTSRDKLNLVIFLTPYIFSNTGDLAKLQSMLGELDKLQNTYDREFYERVKLDGLEKFLINPDSEDVKQVDSNVSSSDKNMTSDKNFTNTSKSST